MRKSVHTAEYAALRGRLVAVREGAGLSQRELGRVLGVPHTWVAKVESGERRIDLVEFGWFCRGCGVEAGEVAREVLGEIRAFGSSQAGMPVPPKRKAGARVGGAKGRTFGASRTGVSDPLKRGGRGKGGGR